MCLILGYLGYNNYGDQILADLLFARLKKKHGQDITINYLSSKNSWKEHFFLLLKSKKIFAIGGMFQDLTSSWSLFYYCLVIFMAKLLSKEIVIFAQGIGPLQTPLTRFITKKTLKLANKISVRDQESSDFLIEDRIPHILVTDWAWTLVDEIENVDIKKFSELKKDSICVALRDSKFIN
ncbi:MAG: hypothetical protein RLZZ361_807, partial [Cyanobacteriota bacterium]